MDKTEIHNGCPVPDVYDQAPPVASLDSSLDREPLDDRGPLFDMRRAGFDTKLPDMASNKHLQRSREAQRLGYTEPLGVGADMNRRFPLNQVVAERGDRGSMIIGGLQPEVRTVWIGVTPAQGQQSRVGFYASITRWGLHTERRFHLEPGQSVGFHADGCTGFELRLASNQIVLDPPAQVVVSGSPNYLVDPNESAVFWVQTVTSGAINVVPDKALRVIIPVALLAFSWLSIPPGIVPPVTVPGPIAAGGTQAPQGYLFSLVTGGGLPVDIVWEIHL